MALIDYTYFETGILQIGQLEQTSVQGIVADCILAHEQDFIDACLGVGFAEAFKTGLEAPTPEQRWVDLELGRIFTGTYQGQLRWNGFAPADKTKVSPLAAYVYWYYVRENFIQTGGIGFVQSQPENGVTVAPIQKQSYAWNEMLKQVGVLWDFLVVNAEVYPEYNSQYINETVFGQYFQNQFGI